MVFEGFKRWRAKTFTGSDVFCQSGTSALEPSSKSAHNLATAEPSSKSEHKLPQVRPDCKVERGVRNEEGG
jgi:hypothetical protein